MEIILEKEYHLFPAQKNLSQSKICFRLLSIEKIIKNRLKVYFCMDLRLAVILGNTSQIDNGFKERQR